MGKRIAILGGGVGGLSAAHELVERGFEVVVFEANSSLGGKARSNTKPETGVGGRDDLPGEHGFRFFPGFYRHLPDTMGRIPYQERTVLDNLVSTAEIQIARANKHELLLPARFPLSPTDVFKTLRFLFDGQLRVEREDLAHFAGRLLVLLTSCSQRRIAEYEKQSWLEFIQAEGRKNPETYKKYMADGLTRSLVAARAGQMSARTGGSILLQLLMDLAKPGSQVNRVLNSPTNQAWIEPWHAYLTSSRWEKPVEFYLGARVEELYFDGQRITGMRIGRNGSLQIYDQFDYYIAALPVEVMRRLVTEPMRTADPCLARLDQLITEWMNGIQFYLKNDITDVLGHTLYIDSPWALTSISQKRFWNDFDLKRCGDGTVGGILSVDISDWNTPGTNGKAAKDCTPEEIKDEVWQQLRDHLNDDDLPQIIDDDLIDWYLDPAIEFPPQHPGPLQNQEPLLINTADSWDCRPKAVTAIANLFLAADYVRTHTDLATMEAANEAARQAVNGILKASGSRARHCKIWRLKEPWSMAPLRWYDRWRFRRGRPHSGAIVWVAHRFALPVWRVGHGTLRVFWRTWQRLQRVRRRRK